MHTVGLHSSKPAFGAARATKNPVTQTLSPAFPGALHWTLGGSITVRFTISSRLMRSPQHLPTDAAASYSVHQLLNWFARSQAGIPMLASRAGVAPSAARSESAAAVARQPIS